MRHVSVVLARVLAHVETVDLNPEGRVFFPDIIRALVDKLEFQKYPTTFEDTDEDKGVNFFEGRWGGVTIDKLTIFRGTLVLDTRVPTVETERILDECLQWGAAELGLAYHPGMVHRRQYISDLTFFSDFDFLGAHKAFVNLQRAISEQASRFFNQKLSYELTKLDLDFDKVQTPLVCAPFSIQRRGGVNFSAHKYFSEAPLPTEIHIELLDRFEADLQGA